jgi:hypothetical protein
MVLMLVPLLGPNVAREGHPRRAWVRRPRRHRRSLPRRGPTSWTPATSTSQQPPAPAKHASPISQRWRGGACLGSGSPVNPTFVGIPGSPHAGSQGVTWTALNHNPKVTPSQGEQLVFGTGNGPQTGPNTRRNAMSIPSNSAQLGRRTPLRTPWSSSDAARSINRTRA